MASSANDIPRLSVRSRTSTESDVLHGPSRGHAAATLPLPPDSLIRSKHALKWSGRGNVRNSIPCSRPARPRPRNQRPPRPCCGHPQRQPRLTTSQPPAPLPPRIRPQRHRLQPSSRFTTAGPAPSPFHGRGLFHGSDASRGRPLTAPPPPLPRGLVRDVIPTPTHGDIYAEAMNTAAVPWPRLKRQPPLPLPAIASSATMHPVVATPPHPRRRHPISASRGLVHGGGLLLFSR